MTEDMQIKASAMSIRKALEELNYEMKINAHPKLSVRIGSTNRFNKQNKADYLELQLRVFQVLEQVVQAPPEPTEPKPKFEVVEGGKKN